MSLLRPARNLLLLLGLALGCQAPEGYDVPGPDTEPSVSVDYPKWYLDQDPQQPPAYFGEASVDLSVTVVPSGNAGTTRVLDLAYPERTELHGYGRYLGMDETYRRTRMVDQHGVHGVRVAVYRSDAERKHTNVWTHFLARGTDGQLFLTEQSQWDWIGGEEETESFTSNAWPFFQPLTRSHYFYDSFFGFTPGIYSNSQYISMVVVSTNATSPTYQIPDCVQIRFNCIDPTLQHQVFMSEKYGLVEIVFAWHDLEGENGWEYPLVPLDGFAAKPEDLTPVPPVQTGYGEVAGFWRGTLDEPQENTVLADGFSLQLDPVAQNYRALSGDYDVTGTYTDAGRSMALRGRVFPGATTIELIAENAETGDDFSIRGLYVVGYQGAERMDVGIARLLPDGTTVSGYATIDWIPP